MSVRGKRVQWGEGNARGARVVDFKQGLGICHLEQGIAFPSKLLSFSKYTPAGLLMCVRRIKEFSVQVKNKPGVRIRNIQLFLVHRSSW